MCVCELHSICHGLLGYHGYIVEGDSVLCEVWIEAEKTVEPLCLSYNIAQPVGSIKVDKINTWFALRIKKLLLKKAVEFLVTRIVRVEQMH